jgi:hypothetical protein
LIAVVALWLVVGWRYGVKPLPAPVAGFAFERIPPASWNAVSANNCWFWAREVERFIRTSRLDRQRPFQEMYLATVDSWARAGARAATAQKEATQWFAEHPEFEEFFVRAAAAGENQPPSHLGSAETRAMQLLTHLPLVKAATRERAGETVAALEHLVDAWRLQARFVPHLEFSGVFDERGLGEIEHKLARPWRRLAATGPHLTEDEGRRLLTELSGVLAALPDLSLSYRRVISTRLASHQRNQRPDWGRVRRAFSQAATLVVQDLVQIPPVIWARLSGYRVNFGNVEGIGHFARPVKLLWDALQKAALRPADLEVAINGTVSRALARLADRHPTGSEAPVPGFWQRWWDRPALWRALDTLPDGSDLRRSRQQWLAYFESCRLALALRIYRERHGDWPAQLSQLVPDVLTSLPADPRSGGAFGYARTPTGWRLWSPGASSSADDADDAEAASRLEFPAMEE